MADRRMFSKSIIDSDAFLDMPLSTQSLYFHLAMRADDEGFVNNPKKIQRMIGASDDDVKVLVTKNFIIPFESGVVVIKHWRIHNYIQNDRFHPTNYTEERALLDVKGNNAYTLVSNLDTDCIPDGYEVDTEVSIGKLGKVSTEKKSTKKKDDLFDGLNMENAKLKDAMNAFVEMRKAMKKPMTPRAVSLLVSKLKEMASDEATQIAIINQSVMNGWLSVYPLKADQGANGVKVNPVKSTDLDGVF